MGCASRDGSGLRCVANHFDVVPIRADDESCIIARMVLRAQTRRTVVLAARRERCAMEGFDLLAIVGREREMKMCRLFLCLVQAQRSLGLGAEFDAVRRW